MPVLRRPDGEIYYEEYGSGYPCCCLRRAACARALRCGTSPRVARRARGTIGRSRSPGRYRVMAMDQRNAGRSRSAIAADHGWHTYAADHLALMDHLGFRGSTRSAAVSVELLPEAVRDRA